MNKIDQLNFVFNNLVANEEVSLLKLINNENPYQIIPFFQNDNVVFALYAIYIKHSFNRAKACFYKAARVAEYMSNQYDWRIIDTGLYKISYAMLSDNKELIKRYATLKNEINDDTSMGYQTANSIQNILLEDWDKLDWNIHCLERFVKLGQFKWFTGIVFILNGFKEKDETLIKKGLEELLLTHKKRNTDPLICKFFSIDTAGLNKLAWIKGYEINLNSSLVPQELMPIEPLDDYPEYDFMK